MHDQEYKLKISRIYLTFLSLVCIGSLLIILYFPPSWWIKLIGFISISIYCWNLFSKARLQNRNAIKSLRWHQDGSWHLYTANESYAGELLGDSTVTTFVSILRFRLSRFQSTSIVIFNDALTKEQYRRLVVLLKLQSRKTN